MTVDTEPEPGQRLGHYVIEKHLGEGGMGVVCLADDPRHGRKVAIKLVRRDRLAEPDLAERFRRESSNQACVSHPNILPLLDSGQHGEVWYFVTPYQPLGDLSALLARRQLTLAEVAHIIRQVAEALSAAHRADIVHRDVKPGNILVAHEDDLSVYLADFGLSHRIADTRLTASGAVHGTFPYMAPEQFIGQDVTPATDVYALAVTTHEMATGHRRCDGDCAAFSVATTSLCEVVRRGTAEKPGRRYATASEFAAAVAAAVDGSDAPVAPPAGSSPADGYARCSNNSLDIRAVTWPPRGPAPDTDPPAPMASSPVSSPTSSAHLTRGTPFGRRRSRLRPAHVFLLVPALVLTLAGAAAALTLQGVLSPPPPATTQTPPGPAMPATPSPTPATSSGPSPSTATAPVQLKETTLAPRSPDRVAPDRSATRPPSVPNAPAGSTILTVCRDNITIRDEPGSLEDGAKVLGELDRGDRFLAYPRQDGGWVQGFAYDLGIEGWALRQTLDSPCPG
jgi:serine/threonine protein kinase